MTHPRPATPEPSDVGCQARNLQALRLFSPRVAACLELQTGSAIVLESSEPAWSVPELQSADVAVLMGLGNGNKPLRLLASPHGQVLAIETDAARLRAVLRRYDLSAALASGRLHLMLMPIASPATREISLRECTALLMDRFERCGGTLHFVGSTQDGPQAEFFAALLQNVQRGAVTAGQFHQARSAGTAAGTTYDVTVISPCCAIFDDLAYCFNRMGLRTQLLRVPDESQAWSAEQLRATQATLFDAPSRLVVSRNRSLFETVEPGAYPQPEAMLASPVAMWWWDIPNLASHIDLGLPRGQSVSLAFARDILRLLPQRSEWLPPAARMPFVETPQHDSEQDIPVSFVGQSRLQNLHENLNQLTHVLHALGGTVPALGRDIERISSYVTLHDYLTRHEQEVRGAIATLAPAYPAHAYYLDYLLQMAVTGAFRVAGIEKLLQSGIAIAVYGDDDWLRVPGMTPANFRGLVAPADLPMLYRRSRVNLNLNFMQVSSTVNPKVLDIAATGSVALTDERPELECLYPDPAARPFAFRTLSQLPETVDALLRADLGCHRQAVREHTLRHHTLALRAEWLARRFGLIA